MTQAFDGGIDPALADAVASIRATHEDEFPRGQEPDAETDADAISGVPASDGADSATYRTAPDAAAPTTRASEADMPVAEATDAPTGEDHG
jgi:hypothetical protein